MCIIFVASDFADWDPFSKNKKIFLNFIHCNKCEMDDSAVPVNMYSLYILVNLICVLPQLGLRTIIKNVS